jgi:N-carbamoyl-D-amino-acid hydrolase
LVGERVLTVGGAQMGPVRRDETREEVVDRLLVLLHAAADRKVELLVYPELALTTFFPPLVHRRHRRDRSLVRNRDAVAFDEAACSTKQLTLGSGSASDTASCRGRRRHQSSLQHSVLVERDGQIVGKHRKVHVPGHADTNPTVPSSTPSATTSNRAPLSGVAGLRRQSGHGDLQRPPLVGDLPGDGSAGVEFILIGYNTPLHYAPDPVSEPASVLPQSPGHAGRGLSKRGVGWSESPKAGSKRAWSPWRVGDHRSVRPDRRPVDHARRRVDQSPEVDLDFTRNYKDTLFKFDRYRVPEAYRLISERKGAGPLIGGIDDDHGYPNRHLHRQWPGGVCPK